MIFVPVISSILSFTLSPILAACRGCVVVSSVFIFVPSAPGSSVSDDFVIVVFIVSTHRVGVTAIVVSALVVVTTFAASPELVSVAFSIVVVISAIDGR